MTAGAARALAETAAAATAPADFGFSEGTFQIFAGSANGHSPAYCCPVPPAYSDDPNRAPAGGGERRAAGARSASRQRGVHQ